MARLRENLSLNPTLARRVRAVQLAAAEAAGELTLYENRREPLYTTTVAGAGAGGVAASADVWSVLQSNMPAMAQAGVAASAVAALADEGVWRSARVRSAPLDEILTDEERACARVIKIDVEGGEWDVIRGMSRTLAEARPDLELVIELTPRWLRMQGVSAASVIRHMHDAGYHAYVLREDYEIRHAFGPTAGRPRRLPLGKPLGCEQADVIFSHVDAEWL